MPICMANNTVRILIDGEAKSVEPGTYTIAQLGLKDVAEITLSETPIRPQVIGANHSFEIRGGESFTTTQKHGEFRDPAVVDGAPAVDPFTGDAVPVGASRRRK